MLPVTQHETMDPVPKPSALIETFAFYILFSKRVVALILTALSSVAPETAPILRRLAFRFSAPSPLAILIQINDLHRLLANLETATSTSVGGTS